jgi:hypothetical protein
VQSPILLNEGIGDSRFAALGPAALHHHLLPRPAGFTFMGSAGQNRTRTFPRCPCGGVGGCRRGAPPMPGAGTRRGIPRLSDSRHAFSWTPSVARAAGSWEWIMRHGPCHLSGTHSLRRSYVGIDPARLWMAPENYAVASAPPHVPAFTAGTSTARSRGPEHSPWLLFGQHDVPGP